MSEPLPYEVCVSGITPDRELPKPLLYEIRTAFDQGVQFGFQKMIDLCDDLILVAELHEAEAQREAFAFVKEWCETTKLEIALDAPSAEESP